VAFLGFIYEAIGRSTKGIDGIGVFALGWG
jgi:hypothetical protein